jgi:hypothetical protein
MWIHAFSTLVAGRYMKTKCPGCPMQEPPLDTPRIGDSCPPSTYRSGDYCGANTCRRPTMYGAGEQPIHRSIPHAQG